jgi:DNA-binding response OmpR family regulator
MSVKILLVDDEPQVIEFMETFLRGEGYDIITASTGPEAVQQAKSEHPAIVVLDWMLPGMSGIDVCRELRKLGNMGVIMVTARTEEADKILGLEVGADDYLTKPFSLRELAARIRSVLRRITSQSSSPGTTDSTDSSDTINYQDLSISEAQCRVWKNGQEITLTPTEFKILLTLASRPGIVYSRLQLLQMAMEDDFLNDERTVDAHISRIRKKIEDDPAHPKYLHTVYGFGYRFGERT